MTLHHHDITRRLRRALLATAAVAAAGCGPAVSNGDSQVWGRVTVRGTPVNEGAVVLKPLAEKDATWGLGPLENDGRFHVAGSRDDVPLLPGRYFVYLRPPTHIDYTAGQFVPVPGYPVPPKYLDPESPRIQVEIKDEPTQLDLKLDE
jgi:hypothetical protein